MNVKFELIAVAIIKNEARYIREWLDFHINVGFQHFVIFDNQSTDNTKLVLEPYIKRSLVTLIDWPYFPGQMPAYKAAVEMLAAFTKWAAFIDADEFLYSTTDQDIKKTLKNYEKYPGIVVHWVIYGSNGHKHFEDLPVLERFTKRELSVNRHVKSIIQPAYTIPTGNDVHVFSFKDRQLAVNEKMAEIPPDTGRITHMDPVADILRINHYVTKSEEECFERCKQGRADNGNKKEWPIFFEQHDCNEIEDFSALERYRGNL